MVWIENKWDELRLIWIDGYAPEREDILKNLMERGELFDSEGMEYKELYQELLNHYKYKRIKHILEKDKKLKNLWTFYFTFEKTPSESYVTHLIWEELTKGEELGKNYSHIIFTFEWVDYNKTLEDKVKSIHKKVIDEAGFKIREPSTYDNFRLFEESCKTILHKMGDYYMVPSLCCIEEIEKMGFSMNDYTND